MGSGGGRAGLISFSLSPFSPPSLSRSHASPLFFSLAFSLPLPFSPVHFFFHFSVVSSPPSLPFLPLLFLSFLSPFFPFSPHLSFFLSLPFLSLLSPFLPVFSLLPCSSPCLSSPFSHSFFSFFTLLSFSFPCLFLPFSLSISSHSLPCLFPPSPLSFPSFLSPLSSPPLSLSPPFSHFFSLLSLLFPLLFPLPFSPPSLSPFFPFSLFFSFHPLFFSSHSLSLFPSPSLSLPCPFLPLLLFSLLRPLPSLSLCLPSLPSVSPISALCVTLSVSVSTCLSSRRRGPALGLCGPAFARLGISVPAVAPDAAVCLSLLLFFLLVLLLRPRSCFLQADSERLLQLWVVAVQNSIASAFNQLPPESQEQGASGPSTPLSTSATLGCGRASSQSGSDQKVMDQVLRLDGNAQCCDCREPAPEWASINLGITLCIECSGIHRSLGVHFSKVRSLTLDSWEPELVKLMCELGNAAINRIYEARVEDMTVKKPGPTCSRQEKEAWIRAKYVEKKFLTKLPEVEGRWRSAGRGGERTSGRPPRGRPPPPPKPLLPPRPGSRVLRTGSAQEELSSLHPGALLFQAAGAPPSLPTMADALAHGADVNWVNAAQANATPLIQATEANSLLACEFLLQNGANVNQTDSAGRGPLHHATIRGFTGLACLFLKRGAGLGVQDADGKDPLTIAMEAANADIVTLLRLAKMREADVALGQAGDETYLDIFRDFSLMASDDPDKLSRRSQDLNTL
uniref:Arf-GAP with coiled-coil, ANK repeat and PH domain-containing protein n=1 Tax=Ornithorhynchus anatinus TaxID=9258 RepID=A0A6I8NE41_ORNAN